MFVFVFVFGFVGSERGDQSVTVPQSRPSLCASQSAHGRLSSRLNFATAPSAPGRNQEKRVKTFMVDLSGAGLLEQRYPSNISIWAIARGARVRVQGQKQGLCPV